MCNGHADTCDNTDPSDPYKLVCRCQHNTCGDQCQTCCSGYQQKAWKQSKANELFVCERKCSKSRSSGTLGDNMQTTGVSSICCYYFATHRLALEEEMEQRNYATGVSSTNDDDLSESDFHDAESQFTGQPESTLLSVLILLLFFAMLFPVMYAINPNSLYIIPVFISLSFISMYAPHFLAYVFFDVRYYCVALVLVIH